MMPENFIETYKRDKSEFLDTVKQQLSQKTLPPIETIRKEVGNSFIQSTRKEEKP